MLKHTMRLHLQHPGTADRNSAECTGKCVRRVQGPKQAVHTYRRTTRHWKITPDRRFDSANDFLTASWSANENSAVRSEQLSGGCTGQETDQNSIENFVDRYASISPQPNSNGKLKSGYFIFAEKAEMLNIVRHGVVEKMHPDVRLISAKTLSDRRIIDDCKDPGLQAMKTDVSNHFVIENYSHLYMTTCFSCIAG